jgi:hypothetical protein
MPLSIATKGALGLVTLGVVGAYEAAPPDIRGDTVFLERLAARLACVQQIPPETHQALSRTLDRLGQDHPRLIQAADLQARRQLALGNIQNALQATDAQPASARGSGDCRQGPR